MGQYKGQNNWIEEIRTFEQTDVVLAETDNIPLQQLADRTEYLKNRLNTLAGYQLGGNGFEITETHPGKVLLLDGAANIANVAIRAIDQFAENALLIIRSKTAAGGVVNLLPATGKFSFDGEILDVLHMHNKEGVFLMRSGNVWVVLNPTGNFSIVGEEVTARKVVNNAAAFLGQELLRARYPRLWQYVSSLTMEQEVTDENTWWNGGLNYQGLFTTGDGVSTFRLPDERGMSERMLDMGRGIDLLRGHNFPGGYEADFIKEHNHTNGAFKYLLKKDGSLTLKDFDSTAHEPNLSAAAEMLPAGTTENTVKNIGKIRQIRY